jgi:hypothetical protein
MKAKLFDDADLCNAIPRAMEHRHALLHFSLAIVLIAGTPAPALAEDPALPQSATAQSILDRVMLKDGSVISNRVIGMVACEPHIKTAFEVGDDIFVSNLGQMDVNRSVSFHLKG